MPPAIAYSIVGVRPDGSPGVRLFTNNPGKARLLAAFLRWECADWEVTIQEIDNQPAQNTTTRTSAVEVLARPDLAGRETALANRLKPYGALNG